MRLENKVALVTGGGTGIWAATFAEQLKSQGYRFVGPTSVYAFMQNIGAVNDHIQGCFRALDHVPAALESLRGLVGEIPQLEELSAALQRL